MCASVSSVCDDAHAVTPVFQHLLNTSHCLPLQSWGNSNRFLMVAQVLRRPVVDWLATSKHAYQRTTNKCPSARLPTTSTRPVLPSMVARVPAAPPNQTLAASVTSCSCAGQYIAAATTTATTSNEWQHPQAAGCQQPTSSVPSRSLAPHHTGTHHSHSC